MSHPREVDEDSDMSLSYSRAPASQQQLPSFRELLPPHLHDEIDSSTFRQSQDRPSSGHEMADPRSIPYNSPSQMPYAEYPREYTTREPRPMSDHLSGSLRGPSPILPPIRDLGSMPERQGYPDSRMAPRSDPFTEYRGAPMPAPMPERREHHAPVMGYGQGPPMPYHEEQVMMNQSSAANFGIMGDSVDPRTRRRRGNLPKPVTDILRAWFHEHLDHPYPSEEDKQMFMTRTGLSISQISNWFINARRRQLPALRNQMRSGGDERQSPFSDVDDHLPSPHH
ncbi:Homeodomain [Penicillium argentinense]|uniref:Homeodomain n=1 Tax=Penicillium argentinense TaxID=1131581 RepID=A0A9W9EYA9_9EURO|nr:Homeodomain [Penicillium argentinense]KAJ5090233.1 Homeodomain [Penicillium argentinense]